MNPDLPNPPSDEMEARLTALLLGELPEEEAVALRRATEQDVRLAALYNRLKQTIEMVRQTAVIPAEQTASQPTPLKLSGERRQRLLAHFKTVAPKEFTSPPRREMSWVIPMSIAAAAVAVIGARVLAPASFSFAQRESTQVAAVENNRRMIEGARDQWALEHKKGPGDTPTPAELANYLKGGDLPKPVAGETYQINPVGTPTAATLPGSREKGIVSTSSASPREDLFTYNSADQLRQAAAPTPKQHQESSAPAAPTGRTKPTEIVLPSGGIPADAGNAQLETRVFHMDPNKLQGPVAQTAVAGIATPRPTAQALAPPDNAIVGSEVPALFKNESETVASVPQKTPVLGDFPALGTTRRDEDAAAEIAARDPFGLKPKAPAPTAGDDLSKWDLAKAETSDKLSKSIAPAFSQQAGKELALMFDRNGKADQPQAGGRTAGEGGLYGVNAVGYANITNRFAAAIEEALPAPAERTEERVADTGAGRRSVSEQNAEEKLARLNQPMDADQRREDRRMGIRTESLTQRGAQALEGMLEEQDKKIASAKRDLERLQPKTNNEPVDAAPPRTTAPALVPQPEIQTRDNAFSTFSLNVADVSFKLAAASLEKGVMPEPASVRSEEFINAFDYRDPEPPPGAPIGFAWERARYPFAHNRDLLRFSVKTAAAGRQPGRPLNLVLLLDNSGSMERADRVRIIQEALRVLAAQLQPQDKFSVITFARTAQLRVDGVSGEQARAVVEQLSGLTPQGGTNLEEAMNLAYQTALRHYLAAGINRVVLLTDGAANLGNVDPETLKQKVEAHRKQGVALDCFGIGWEGYNDDLLEVLSRNGDGRYGFLNAPEEAATEFASQLAGALHVAASDVKVQVEFNPARVSAYRQIGYAKHQLTKEQFRDNTVDAAEIGAAESGNALYAVEVNPAGEGPLAVVRVRFRTPGTAEYREHEWVVPYTGNAPLLEQSGPALRLAATASAFSEWLASSPYTADVSPDRLLGYLAGVPEIYGADARPKKLEWMIRQAKSLSGKRPRDFE